MPDGIDADDGAGVGGVDHLRAGVVGTGLGRVVDAGGNKTGATRLGFAVLLKFFEIAARVPERGG